MRMRIPKSVMNATIIFVRRRAETTISRRAETSIGRRGRAKTAFRRNKFKGMIGIRLIVVVKIGYESVRIVHLFVGVRWQTKNISRKTRNICFARIRMLNSNAIK